MGKQPLLQEHEPPLVVMGRLREAINITGYGYNRVAAELNYLLTDHRWADCGYPSLESFMERLQLGSLKPTVQQRRELEKKLLTEGEFSNRQLAKMVGVSPETVNKDMRTANLLAAEPEKPQENNDAEATDANLLALPPEKPQAFTLGHDSVAKLVQGVARRAEAGDRREQRLADINAANRALTTGIRYPIILADPPWRYENPPIGASSRSIENHYPTMTLEEICDLPVKDLGWDDGLLYLWATAPKLAECLQVVSAWGFEYRTNLVWDKIDIGMGYHARNQHELLLVAKRGTIPPPEAGKQPASIYREKAGEHSVKPVFFYEMIEAAYPDLAKIELFSRAPRAGWDSWGNQASEVTDAA